MYDPHTKESRGFGFVMMKSNEDAMKVIADLDNKEFMGKCLRIQVVRWLRYVSRKVLVTDHSIQLM